MERIPDSFKRPFHSNDIYNPMLRWLEDYIIRKYDPYVIDLSRFYCGDANEWENLNGAHFEKEFYTDSFEIGCRITRKNPENVILAVSPFWDELDSIDFENAWYSWQIPSKIKKLILASNFICLF